MFFSLFKESLFCDIRRLYRHLKKKIGVEIRQRQKRNGTAFAELSTRVMSATKLINRRECIVPLRLEYLCLYFIFGYIYSHRELKKCGAWTSMFALSDWLFGPSYRLIPRSHWLRIECSEPASTPRFLRCR